MNRDTTKPGSLKKLWLIMLPGQRRETVTLLVLMLIGAVLETFGISLVIPALALLTQSDFVGQYPILSPLLERLGNPAREELVIIGMGVFVFVFLIKFLFLVFLAWRQMRLVFSFQADLSRRLFLGYLRRPYTFHLVRNSAELLRNVIGEVGALTNLTPSALFLTAEVLVLIGLSAVLIAVEPMGALITIGIGGGASWLFHVVTRRSIPGWGRARQKHEGFRIQHLQQALGGIKEVKLLGRESAFLSQYDIHNIATAQALRRQYTVQQLPRLWLEFLAVTALATLVLTLIRQGDPLVELIPIVGLFAAAAFRIMPSLNRIISSGQAIRYTLPAIDMLYEEIQLVEQPSTAQAKLPVSFNKALTIEGVSFQYDTAEKKSVRNVTLSVKRGTSVGFIGTSGAGKSTLVDMILGLLTPSEGVISVDGVDIQGNLRGWQDLVGYVPQAIFLTDDSLRHNVAFGLADDQIDDEAVWKAVRDAQLAPFIDDLPEGLDAVVGERGVRLSAGQLQRIGIARALYHDPAVLVLDEASSSLDVATEKSLMDAVNKLAGDKTVLIITHRLSTVQTCDYVFRLEAGVVVEEGAPSDVLGAHT